MLILYPLLLLWCCIYKTEKQHMQLMIGYQSLSSRVRMNETNYSSPTIHYSMFLMNVYSQL